MVDAQSVLNRINSEFTSAIGQPPVVASAPPLAAGQFTAGLATSGNGLAFTQNLTGSPTALRVEGLNNSGALDGLGLTGGTYDATSATFTAQDAASIQVDNIFTSLVRLRDALRANDSSGITVAGGSLDDQVNRLSQAQALVGVYANRVKQATTQQTSENTTNEQFRSQLQDVDFTEASIRYSNLRIQLQAALQTGAQSQNLSLLNFLK